MAIRNEALEELNVGNLEIERLPDERVRRTQFAGPKFFKLNTQANPAWSRVELGFMRNG